MNLNRIAPFGMNVLLGNLNTKQKQNISLLYWFHRDFQVIRYITVYYYFCFV